MKRIGILLLFAFIPVIVLANLAGGSMAAAQAPEPTPLVPAGGPVIEGVPGAPGVYHPRLSRMEASISSAEASPGDNFGYTRLDGAGYGWQDATSGNEVIFQGNVDDNYAGPIDIGFSFKFYENTYSKVYISTNGLLTFGSGGSYARNEYIPHVTAPNNVIAPLWDDLALQVESVPTVGKIYYKLSGSSPNRIFVVQWQDVILRVGEGGTLTFQALLYENGDIKFQYQTLNGSTGEATIGIEDADGIDGLLFAYNSAGPSEGQAILFQRPAPGARVKFLPTYQGAFSISGKSTFSLEIRNPGEVGSDVFDLAPASSAPGWNVRFYNQSGSAQLNDSDGDGKVDTAAISPGASKTITVILEAPPTAAAGDRTNVTLTAASSKDPSKQAQTMLASAVPAPFGQAFADNEMGIRLGLIWSATQANPKVKDWFSGSTLAVGQTYQGNYIYAWEKNESKLVGSDLVLYADIEYALVSRGGSILRVADKLTNNSAVTQTTTDRSPVAASAPDGKIGLVWVRSITNQLLETKSNVFFAILNADGTVALQPQNLTNNIEWRGSEDYGVPLFISPRIAATSDNRFVIAWVDQRVHSSAQDAETSDIVMASIDTNGSYVKGKSAVTQSTPGGARYFDPNLTELSNSRAFLSYATSDAVGASSSINFIVLNSQGAELKNQTAIAGSSGWSPDAVQLNSGKILLAWTNGLNNKIGYVLLNNSTYSTAMSPQDLSAPDGRQADFVSVTRDKDGHGIITWMDVQWNHHLYYALVDASGNAITPPMVFLRGQSTDPLVLSSYAGQGNAPYDGAWQTYIPFIQK